MMPADIKDSIKQQEIKGLVAHLTNLCKKYLQSLKYSGKRGRIFHLILVGIPSILILSVKEQNPLSMTKVISEQSHESYLSTVPCLVYIFLAEKQIQHMRRRVLFPYISVINHIPCIS